MKVVQCDFASASLVQNVFLNEDPSTDPFEDWYLRTILSMDRNTLMRIPILDDATFLKQLNEGVIDKKGLTLKNNPAPMSDKKLDEELLSQSSIEESWEDLIVAGPIAVNYIGNLMVLSSKNDFTLPLPTPDYVYKYIKYPNSFRTTLVQIAHEMYNAFINAHTNMDRIQLNMQQIPRHIKTVFQLLTSASNRLLQSMLPTTLGHIERIAKECADVANSTMKIFQSVTGLLQEASEITINTYGYNGALLNNITGLMNNSINQQANITFQLEAIRKRYEEAKIVLDKAREEYYNAYHAIPTRPQRFLGFVIGGVIGGIIGGGLVCIFTSCASKPHPPIDNRPFENAKELAEMALQRLKEAEAEYDKWYSQMLEQQNQLAATLIQLSQLDIEHIDYQTTIDILAKATVEINVLGEQWSNITMFFTALAIRAEASRETILHEFIDTIKNVTLIDGELDNADREFFVLHMLDVADEIERGAHLLYIMSKTYYDVSNQYIINQISGLAALAVIQTDSERQIRMQQLAQDTLSTSAKVSRMAQDRKQQYNLRNEARQHEYNMYIQQIMAEELEGSIGK